MPSPVRALVVFACLFGPSALVITCRSWHTGERNFSDDGWRRTKSGWERVEKWPSRTSAPFTSDSRATSSWRFDTHPAALALTQLAAIALGFSAFPVQGIARQSNPLRHWRSALAQSFRASLFGA